MSLNVCILLEFTARCRWWWIQAKTSANENKPETRTARPSRWIRATTANNMLHNILVVGGNGFIGMALYGMSERRCLIYDLGSAVCRAALAQGMQVTSIRSFAVTAIQTPVPSNDAQSAPQGVLFELVKATLQHGHLKCVFTRRDACLRTIDGSGQINWVAADAFEPASYRDILVDKTAVVHTLGTLLEDTGYKQAIKDGDVIGLAGSLFKGLTGIRAGGASPLETGEKRTGKSYERINRDSGMLLLPSSSNTFLCCVIDGSASSMRIIRVPWRSFPRIRSENFHLHFGGGHFQAIHTITIH